MDTPKPQIGTWKLTDPDGTEFKAESPLHCCHKERETRVPAKVELDRIFVAMNMKKCFLCGRNDYEFTLGHGTPAEIKVCQTCKNALFTLVD